MKNQPKLKLASADDQHVDLEWTEANGVALTDPHMHSLKITFEGPDSIKEEWTGFKEGKLQDTTTINLKRA